MSASGRCLASCRLLPLHTPYAVRDRREGVIVESWSRHVFQHARRNPSEVLVRVGHGGPEIGRLNTLVAHRDWIHADFVFDDWLADVIVPGLGVSVGVDITDADRTKGFGPSGIRRHREFGMLEEISLTRRPSVPGAKVLTVTRIQQPEPKPRGHGDVVITHPPGAVIRRPCGGRVIGVR